MAAVGRGLEEVGLRSPRQFGDIPASFFRELPKSVSDAGIAAVDENLLSRLGIFQLEQTDRGQLLFARIGQANGDEVVAAAGVAQGALKALIEKVAEEEDDGPPP